MAMLINADGWYATFINRLKDGRTTNYRKALVAWQESTSGGVQGLVIAGDEGHLRPAPSFTNFAGYGNVNEYPTAEDIVAVAPAAEGTVAVYKNEDGSETQCPVSLWGVQRDGDVVALDEGSDGHACRVDGPDNFLRLEFGAAGGPR